MKREDYISNSCKSILLFWTEAPSCEAACTCRHQKHKLTTRKNEVAKWILRGH